MFHLAPQLWWSVGLGGKSAFEVAGSFLFLSFAKLGPPARCPFNPFLGSPQIDYGQKGTLILTSLLEDLGLFGAGEVSRPKGSYG